MKQTKARARLIEAAREIVADNDTPTFDDVVVTYTTVDEAAQPLNAALSQAVFRHLNSNLRLHVALAARTGGGTPIVACEEWPMLDFECPPQVVAWPKQAVTALSDPTSPGFPKTVFEVRRPIPAPFFVATLDAWLDAYIKSKDAP